MSCQLKVAAHEMACFTTHNIQLKVRLRAEMLCFTMATAVGGREGRTRQKAVAATFAYVSLCTAMVAHSCLCSPMVGSVH